MKLRFWPTFIALVSIVALAAEEAPPAELLQNLDFYQNMNMVQDQEFLGMELHRPDQALKFATGEPPVVDSTTIHLRENADDSK
jgi:hypothetical protein